MYNDWSSDASLLFLRPLLVVYTALYFLFWLSGPFSFHPRGPYSFTCPELNRALQLRGLVHIFAFTPFWHLFAHCFRFLMPFSLRTLLSLGIQFRNSDHGRGVSGANGVFFSFLTGISAASVLYGGMRLFGWPGRHAGRVTDITYYLERF